MGGGFPLSRPFSILSFTFYNNIKVTVRVIYYCEIVSRTGWPLNFGVFNIKSQKKVQFFLIWPSNVFIVIKLKEIWIYCEFLAGKKSLEIIPLADNFFVLIIFAANSNPVCLCTHLLTTENAPLKNKQSLISYANTVSFQLILINVFKMLLF